MCPWAFSPYFLLLLCVLEEWKTGWVEVPRSQPRSAHWRGGWESETTLQLSGVWQGSAELVYDGDMNHRALGLLKEKFCCGTNRAWCVCSGALVGAIEKFAYQVQSKAGRDASPVQSSPSWNISPSPNDLSYSFFWLQIYFHWRKPNTNDPHCLLWLGYLVTDLSHMDDGLQSQEHWSLLENISGVFMSRNTHNINEIIACLSPFMIPLQTGFVCVESDKPILGFSPPTIYLCILHILSLLWLLIAETKFKDKSNWHCWWTDIVIKQHLIF